MLTLGDIINEITKIRNAIDGIEVKHHENRQLLEFAYERCDKLIASINQAATEIQNGGNSTTLVEHPEEG